MNTEQKEGHIANVLYKLGKGDGPSGKDTRSWGREALLCHSKEKE